MSRQQRQGCRTTLGSRFLLLVSSAFAARCLYYVHTPPACSASPFQKEGVLAAGGGGSPSGESRPTPTRMAGGLAAAFLHSPWSRQPNRIHARCLPAIPGARILFSPVGPTPARKELLARA
ncbi:hypothetical protein MRX96_026464 [Rhipicephalus microplus]